MDSNLNLKKTNIDLENLMVLYRHYKDFLLPVGVVLASVLVIIYVIFPQIQQYFSLQSSVQAEQQKLEALKSNYNLLASLNDATITSDLSTLSSALPAQKDFAGIINAISYVAAKTGVSVGNFEFSLGNLSSTNFGGTAYPSTKLNISLRGNVKGMTQFIQEIAKTMPVAEVTSVNITNDAGSMTILFYYKPYPVQNVSDSASIVPLTASQTQLIKTVSAWNSTGETNSLIPATTATEAASTSPF